MTENPGYRGRRQARGRRPVGRTTAARCGAVTAFIALILIVTSASAMGAPLRQSTTDAADLEPPTNSSTTAEASRMAAIVAVVNRQGIQGPVNLKPVSAVAVANLVAKPALVVDARAKRAAEAEAAALAAAVAATEVALSVQATVESQEAEADAAASATAAAVATATATERVRAAEAATALSAKRQAQFRAVEAAATRNTDAPAPAVVASESKLPVQMSSLLIALMPMLGGLLGLRLWRIKKEPFVLKANPTPARSSASA